MTLRILRNSGPVWRVVILLVALFALVALKVMHRPALPPIQKPNDPVQMATANSPSRDTAANVDRSSASTAIVLPNWPEFQKRPFPVAYGSPHFEWTLADGKDTNVIQRLAHNPLEYDRMVEENSRIFKRQLVYLKETPASVFEQARLTGEAVRQLTLPGVDGQELQFEIVKSQSGSSSRQGMFSGHLVGNTESFVTLAFEDGRQAFTILSPKENVFIVGEPREDGQAIVKAIDPKTYGAAPLANCAITTDSGNK